MLGRERPVRKQGTTPRPLPLTAAASEAALQNTVALDRSLWTQTPASRDDPAQPANQTGAAILSYPRRSVAASRTRRLGEDASVFAPGR